MAEGEDQHALNLINLEHELAQAWSLTDHMKPVEIRKLQGKKILDLKNEMQESDLAFGQVYKII